MESYAHLGANVRYFRVALELSQQELAERTGGVFTQRYLSDIERGLRPTDPRDVDALAAALNVSPDILLRKPRIVRHIAHLHPVVLQSTPEPVLVGSTGGL